MKPDRSSLWNVLAGRSNHAHLRAVCCLHHIVTARSEKHLPHYGSGHRVFGLLGLAGPKLDDVLTDRHRAFCAVHKLAASSAERAAGERDVTVVKHLAAHYIARADETRHELRTRSLVDLLG